jgi:hypothetical protein
LLDLAAAGALIEAIGGDGGSDVYAMILAAGLLLPAIAAGLGAHGDEPWLRREQHAARAFAERPMSAPRAFRNLPARSYAPVVASIELALYLVTLITIALGLLGTVPVGDVVGTLMLLVASAAWLGLSIVWARALRQMLEFRRAAG